MIAFELPQLDMALIIAGLGVALTLGLGHVAMLPGLFVKTEPPRPVAYVMGLGVVLGYFTLLYILARHQPYARLQPVFDIWFLAAAGAIPTIGFRILRRYLHLQDEVKSANQTL